jgi:predicted dehydrogenase
MLRTRIGIIGAGWWATENHIPVLQSLPNVDVTSICGLGREQLEKVRQKFGIGFATEDYEELLSRPDVDGVVVSSPHNFHYRHAAAALERGFPVLCEKPMALDTAEAGRLVKLVEAKRLPFLIPYGWNYTELADLAKDAIDSGEIGEVEHVLCHMGSPARDLLSGTGAWVAERALLKPAQGTWSDPSAGGGFAHGQLSHALGLMLWVTGLQASEVFAHVQRSLSGSDLSVAISCRFSNRATGMLGGTGGIPSRSLFQVDIRVFGSTGMLLLDIERPRLEIHGNNGKHFSAPTNHPPGMYECIEPLKVFVGLLQGEPMENRSPAWLGKRVVDVLDASLRSSSTGKTVSIS